MGVGGGFFEKVEIFSTNTVLFFSTEPETCNLKQKQKPSDVANDQYLDALRKPSPRFHPPLRRKLSASVASFVIVFSRVEHPNGRKLKLLLVTRKT